MKFNIYPQEFPALSRYLLRFADSGRFRTSLSAVQSAARDVGELPASCRLSANRIRSRTGNAKISYLCPKSEFP